MSWLRLVKLFLGGQTVTLGNSSGGGDWTVRPAREGLIDQDKGSSEASDDDTDPEQSDQLSITSYKG